MPAFFELLAAVRLIRIKIVMPFYAVRRGHTPGIYSTWADCQEQIVKFSGAKYKKFATEALAQAFVDGNNNPENSAALNADVDWKGLCQQAAICLKRSLKESNTQLNKIGQLITENSENKDDLLASLQVVKKSIKSTEKEAATLMSQVEGAVSNESASKRKLSPSDTTEKKKKTAEGDDPMYTWVYTDGACSNNGKHGSQAGLGVWFGPIDPRNLKKRLPGRQTNNRAEIHAACEAIEIALSSNITHLEIRTDSKFMIQSMTEWLSGWKRKGWKLSDGGDVKNKEDFQRLDDLCQKITVKWTHVRGHSGEPGNEAADQLAVDGARLPLPE